MPDETKNLSEVVSALEADLAAAKARLAALEAAVLSHAAPQLESVGHDGLAALRRWYEEMKTKLAGKAPAPAQAPSPPVPSQPPQS